MHPSDARLSSWNPSNFIVGTSAVNTFPGYMWSQFPTASPLLHPVYANTFMFKVSVNNDHLIYFKLSAAQTATSHTIRIGITEAFANGRPQITVNTWVSAAPAASNQASTRSLTVGTYRGTNTVFTVSTFVFLFTFYRVGDRLTLRKIVYRTRNRVPCCGFVQHLEDHSYQWKFWDYLLKPWNFYRFY